MSVPEAAKSLTLTAGGATLQISAQLSIVGSLTATQGLISVASGQTFTLSGAVGFGVTNNYGPTVEGPGTLQTTGATTLLAQTNDYEALYLGDGATWTNSGTVTDGGLINFGVKNNDTAAFVNTASGTFDLTTGNAAITSYASGDTATFTNAGLLEKTGGTGTSTIAATVTNSGTISVTSGALSLSGGGTLGGSLITSNSGTLAFTSGSFSLTNAAIAAALLVDGGTVTVTTATAMSGGLSESSGTLVIAATSSESGPVTATQGVISVASGQTFTLSGAVGIGLNDTNGPTIDGPGTLQTTGATTLGMQTVGGYVDLYLGDGATWTNSGTVTDGGQIDFGVKSNDTAAFVNAASGTFDLTTDTAGLVAYTGGDTATFTNAGLLEKTGGTATSTIAAAVNNTGTISVTSGELALSGSVSNTGSLEAEDGAALVVTGAVTGTGQIVVGAGSVVELSGVTSENVAFATGAGTLKLDNPASFTGTISGLTAVSTIDLSNVSATSAVLNNGSLAVSLVGGGTLTLAVGGDFVGGQVNVSGKSLTVAAGNLAPAVPTIEELSGGGTFTQNGNSYTINLGTVVQGSNPITIGLGVLNSATAPSDSLAASFTASAAAGFSLSGLAALSGVASGQTNQAPTVTLSTTNAGSFSQTITLDPRQYGSHWIDNYSCSRDANSCWDGRHQ